MATTTGCSTLLEEVNQIEQVGIVPSLPPSPTVPGTPSGDALPPDAPTPTITLTPGSPETGSQGVGSTTGGQGFESTAEATDGPVVDYFVFSPELVSPGDDFQLFWKTQGGIEAAVYRENNDGSPGRTWDADLEGSLTVTAGEGGEEVFVLSVTDGLVTEQVRLIIPVSCSIGWFFDAVTVESCPESDPVTTNARAQQFESGRMFWFEQTGQILIVFNTPPEEISEENPAWLLVNDTWFTGDPVEDPDIVPPEGFIDPERGFGKAWRETPGVRERLGWATGGEIEYVAVLQTADTLDGRELYFTDETATIFVTLPEGTGWQIVGRLQ
ncbi:MAG: hypothetical protein GYB64_18665 [Chloroflexi bacterium]|nr:hypothetical protein [Chloroflexota bacterium]